MQAEVIESQTSVSPVRADIAQKILRSQWYFSLWKTNNSKGHTNFLKDLLGNFTWKNNRFEWLVYRRGTFCCWAWIESSFVFSLLCLGINGLNLKGNQIEIFKFDEETFWFNLNHSVLTIGSPHSAKCYHLTYEDQG